jgi:hypothetical protein
MAARAPTRTVLFIATAIVIPVALLLSGSTPAIACTPPAGGPIRLSVADRTISAPVVLVGTVTSVDDSPGGPNFLQTATVEVEDYIKGDGPAEVKIGNFGHSSLCMTSVRAGQRAIFFARGEPGEGLSAKGTGPSDAVALADPDNVAEARAAASPPPTPTPTVTPTITPTMTPTVTPTPTSEPTVRSTATPSPAPTPSPISTHTTTPTAIAAPSVVPTAIPTQTQTPELDGTAAESSGGPCSGRGSTSPVEGLLSLVLLVSPAGLVYARPRWGRPHAQAQFPADASTRGPAS